MLNFVRAKCKWITNTATLYLVSTNSDRSSMYWVSMSKCSPAKMP